MPVLEVRDAVKRYGGVTALKHVSFAVEPGSVHALLGENGAGKSTLVKIIAGVVRPDSGELLLDGEPVRFSSTLDAGRRGIAVVSQELNLFPDLDVIGNMFMMRERVRGGMVFDRRAMERRARPILEELGVDVPLRSSLAELTLAERQLIEIGKALLTEPRVLVLDEPTSALDDHSAGRLLDVMRVLRQRQVAVVFVTHILEEVMQVGDKVTIMRDGQVVVSAADRGELTIDDIVDGMLGDRRAAVTEAVLDTHVRKPPENASELRLEEVTVPRELHGVSMRAQAGEIVGLAGIVGAGHRSVLRVVSGMRPPSRGRVIVPDRVAARGARSLRAAVRHGIALVSGDRARGLVHDAPIWLNMAHVRAISLGRDGVLPRRKALRRRAERSAAELGVKASDVNQRVGALSGGNQQKVVLAKWLDAEPGVLLLDDPTRGVDIGAKAEMHELIRRASEKCVVLLCSTDLDELAGLCDRVIVFRGGLIACELSGEDLNRHRLLAEMNVAESV